MRMRNSRLRLLPSFDRRDHGHCRFCYYGPENGAHLLTLCPSLPRDLARARDQLLADIAAAYGIAAGGSTRSGTSSLSSRVLAFLWPPPQEDRPDLLCRLLVLSKRLLHVYAASAPSWEAVDLRTQFPVRRARPRFRTSILPVHEQGLDDLALSTPT